MGAALASCTRLTELFVHSLDLQQPLLLPQLRTLEMWHLALRGAAYLRAPQLHSDIQDSG